MTRCEFFGHKWYYFPHSLSTGDQAGVAPRRYCERCKLTQEEIRVRIPESRQVVEIVTAAVDRNIWVDL